MSDIPRVPNVTPSSLVNPQVHRVDQSGDRQPRKEQEQSKEDILELHGLDEPDGEAPAAGSVDFGDEGFLDIAV